MKANYCKLSDIPSRVGGIRKKDDSMRKALRTFDKSSQEVLYFELADAKECKRVSTNAKAYIASEHLNLKVLQRKNAVYVVHVVDDVVADE